MLSLHQVNLSLQNTLCIQQLSLDIQQQGISIILGANGSGKTLLLSLCAGLLSPSSGAIKYYLEGFTNEKTKPNYPKLIFVPSQPVMLDRTVYHNILFPLQCNHIHDADKRCQEALQWADIENLSTASAASLSIGQQQLVALARAWALQPQLLLLDEPCANLDPNRQQHIEQLIQTLSKSGCKIVMSSHHIAQAKRLADDIIFLDTGKLVIQTSSKQFFNNTSSALPIDTIKKIENFIRYA